MNTQKFKPSVNKKFLILLSGAMWSGVGILLNWIAAKWLPNLEQWQIVLTYSLGVVLGLTIAKFGFSKLAKKNCDRILKYSKKVCIFAFQRWQMYLLIVFMMTMGIYMRTSGLIPKFLLAPVYVGIGLALFIGSFVYYRVFFSEEDK